MRKNKKFGLSSIIITIIMIAVFVVVNAGVTLLSDRYPLSKDLSSLKIYELSEYTENVLKALDKDVTVYTIYNKGQKNALVDEILTRYQRVTNRVQVHNVTSGEMPELSLKYDKNAEGIQSGTVIFECGDKSSVIVPGDLTNYNYYTNTETEFYAEERFTQAVIEVTGDMQKEVWCLTGHGEEYTDLTEIFDRYSYVKRLVSLDTAADKDTVVTTDGIENDTVLTVTKAIPNACTVLLIREPTADFTHLEIMMIDEYLQSGGSLMVLLDPLTGNDAIDDVQAPYVLYQYLYEQGIEVQNNAYVIEQGNRRIDENGFGFYATGTAHAIAANVLSDQSAPMVVSSAKPILMNENTSAYNRVIMSTTENGQIAFLSADDTNGQSTIAYGSVPVGISSETGKGKIVVYGCSRSFDDLLTNQPEFSNRDMFLNSLEWLHEDYINTGIRPKSLAFTYMPITDGQSTAIKVIIIAFPILIVVFGVYTWIRRRHK